MILCVLTTVKLLTFIIFSIIMVLAHMIYVVINPVDRLASYPVTGVKVSR